MGDKSDGKTKQVSSQYVVLENRPLDLWKVTELKEELKKRKLITRGLKEELVKRLDEAIRAERDDDDDDKRDIVNDLNGEAQPKVQSDDAENNTSDVMDHTRDKSEKLEKDNKVDDLGNNSNDDDDDDKRDIENDLNGEAQPKVQSDDAENNTSDVMDHTRDKSEKLEKDNRVDDLGNNSDEKTDVEIGMNMAHADDGSRSLTEKTAIEEEGGIVSTKVESFMVVQEISVETTVTVCEESVGGSYQEAQNDKPKPGSSDLDCGKQVDEVSKVQSHSISVDTISNIEKNELKDNVIANDVKLEINVKPETVQQLSTNMVLDESKSKALKVSEEKDIDIVEGTGVSNEKDNVIANDVKLGIDVKLVNEPPKEKVTDEEKDVNGAENVDISKKIDSGDVISSEKLNLDRSSGDDSMEEDGLESKQIDSKFSSDEVGNKNEKVEVKEDDSVHAMVEDAIKNEKVEVKEDDSVHAMVEDAIADKNFVATEDKTAPGVTSTKRKSHDQEKAAETSEILKRQRRWNTENLEVPKQQPTNLSTSSTPKDAFETLAKPAFSRSESTNSQNLPMERVVPPSSKAPTASLRIDNFLRPFTLKAVQEFLGKTGTVVGFWMDQIKTHCYVTYASVEEAIETRNAVCNLQWPVNGGRLLMANFVDPQEVKNRVDPPPPSPATLATTMPPVTMQPLQPSPRLKRQLPPPPSLPPPPPLSNPLPARNHAPPPPPPEKIDPPIVTLDDLFRKTTATPRIYYLPLSDEQVAAKKLNAQGKPANE